MHVDREPGLAVKRDRGERERGGHIVSPISQSGSGQLKLLQASKDVGQSCHIARAVNDADDHKRIR